MGARLLSSLLVLLCASFSPGPRFLASTVPAGHAETRLDLAPEALAETRAALDSIFQGDLHAALPVAREIEGRLPDHPIGYLLEAEALWWKLYCESCSIRYNLIDVWSRPKHKEDDAYFALVRHAVKLAEQDIKRAETAAMHTFAGMGYGLEARLHGLRGENLAVARSGVKGRDHLLRALALDPQMGDALTGLGLYNYLADALSPFARMLRFFMGIPGGNKKEGIRQLESAMNTAELTAVEARFYLARNLRNFDQQYARGAELLEPLVAQYPDNPVFQLLLGDMYAKLARRDPAKKHFQAALKIHVNDSACAARVQQLASASLAALAH